VRRSAWAAIVVAALAAATVAATAFPAAAPAQEPATCAWSSGLDPFPYPFNPRKRYSLPRCRLAINGTRDEGSPRANHARRFFGRLRRNRGRRGRRAWTFVDSLGRRLAVVELKVRKWLVRNPATHRLIYRQRRPAPYKLELQGRACMASDRLERRYALVAIHIGRRRTRVRGRRPSRRTNLVPYQLRAFVPRRALPRRGRRRLRISGVVDHYAVDCVSSELPEPEPAPLGNPRFRERRHRYVGTDGIDRRYATYNAKPAFQGARYLVTHTTAVRGGGIVRAVVRASDPISVVDGFGYCDPNYGRRPIKRPVATWSFGRVAGTRVWGWLANRC
jgi:hypothetical protein